MYLLSLFATVWAATVAFIIPSPVGTFAFGVVAFCAAAPGVLFGAMEIRDHLREVS